EKQLETRSDCPKSFSHERIPCEAAPALEGASRGGNFSKPPKESAWVMFLFFWDGQKRGNVAG
ncbi:unnamed protein product, partial [Effrenium voratum]